METVVKVEHLTKVFKLPHDQQSSIKGKLINFHKHGYETQVVLDDVSFTVEKGDFIGIVGRNGSGKSTLLKLLAGIYEPNKGSIGVTGKLTPFIELGVGFNPELSGRDNVFLNGALLGFSRKEMEQKYDEIVAFSELDRFMDQKLKNYSSGMQVRLAFSIAIQANTDILLLDEVLAVGDAAFQRKCFDYFMELKKNKQTVILVTHDMSAVRQYCDKAIMIEKGKIVHSGTPMMVSQEYQKLFSKNVQTFEAGEERWGDGGIRGSVKHISVESDDIKVETEYVASDKLDSPIYGITLYGPDGTNILEVNTYTVEKQTDPVEPGNIVSIVWNIPNIFNSGRYTLGIGCCNASFTQFYDTLNNAGSFSITTDINTGGLVNPHMELAQYEVRRSA